jgi:hypothetical protein
VLLMVAGRCVKWLEVDWTKVRYAASGQLR